LAELEKLGAMSRQEGIDFCLRGFHNLATCGGGAALRVAPFSIRGRICFFGVSSFIYSRDPHKEAPPPLSST
jgi:hypothetical protein